MADTYGFFLQIVERLHDIQGHEVAGNFAKAKPSQLQPATYKFVSLCFWHHD